MTPAFKEITHNGLWKQNPGVVQLLGLCPTLAVTTSAVNGLSLGLATALVMSAANGAVSPVRRFIPSEIRVPVFILVIAALVTVIDLSINAFAHELHKVLGIFIPLIVVNCIVLARVESFAAKKHPRAFNCGWVDDGPWALISAHFTRRDARTHWQRHGTFRP